MDKVIVSKFTCLFSKQRFVRTCRVFVGGEDKGISWFNGNKEIELPAGKHSIQMKDLTGLVASNTLSFEAKNGAVARIEIQGSRTWWLNFLMTFFGVFVYSVITDMSHFQGYRLYVVVFVMLCAWGVYLLFPKNYAVIEQVK